MWRKDLVAESFNAGLDELYGYDRLYRLKLVNRGTLNSTNTAINTGTSTFNQCWTLDSTGNWKGFREDNTGTGNWSLIQARSANPVNEITAITNSVGSAWVQPVYDKNGNMATMPQPATPTSSYTGTYDAWNRLVKLVDPSSGNTVQTNVYDGRTYRTIRNTFTGGVNTETRHAYYTATWRDIEERLGTSANAERQFVWGLRYIDDLILRDRSTANNGVMDERHYGMQDPNWNMLAIANSAGVVQERYSYAPYGKPSFLTSFFEIQFVSIFGWETLFTGYRFDVSSCVYFVRNRTLNSAVGWQSRDPLLHAAGINFYEYGTARPASTVDPYGTDIVPSVSPTAFRGRTCIFIMDGPWTDYKRWLTAAEQLSTLIGENNSTIKYSVDNIDEITNYIVNNKCCQVIMLGHRGGPANPGGIVTGPTIILPSPNLPGKIGNEQKIAAAISSNKCGKKCNLYIYACGDGNQQGKLNQQRLANKTGCIVCGTRKLQSIGSATPGIDMHTDPPTNTPAADFDLKTGAPEPEVICRSPE